MADLNAVLTGAGQVGGPEGQQGVLAAGVDSRVVTGAGSSARATAASSPQLRDGSSSSSDSDGDTDAQRPAKRGKAPLASSKLFSKALAQLTKAHTKHGSEFVMGVLDKQGMVHQYSSRGMLQLLANVDFCSTMPATKCISDMQRILAKSKHSSTTFEQLSSKQQSDLLMFLLDVAISHRKQLMPFTFTFNGEQQTTDTEVVVERTGWWPGETVPYVHPSALTPQQRSQLMSSMAAATREPADGPPLKNLVVNAFSQLYKLGVPADVEEAYKAVLRRAFTGPQRVQQTHSVTGLVAGACEPCASQLVTAGDVCYLGAGGATADDVQACLDKRGKSHKGIKNGRVKIAGVDVEAHKLYNEVASAGGYDKVWPKTGGTDLPALGLIQVKLDIPHKKDSYTLIKRSYEVNLLPLTEAGAGTSTSSGAGQGSEGAAATADGDDRDVSRDQAADATEEHVEDAAAEQQQQQQPSTFLPEAAVAAPSRRSNRPPAPKRKRSD